MHCFIGVAMLRFYRVRMQMNGKEYHAILERAAANVVTIDIANALIDGAISVSGPPVSSDVRSQPLDFQSIASDLHLVKSDLCTRCVAASIQCQTLAVLVQLEFLAAQPLNWTSGGCLPGKQAFHRPDSEQWSQRHTG